MQYCQSSEWWYSIPVFYWTLISQSKENTIMKTSYASSTNRSLYVASLVALPSDCLLPYNWIVSAPTIGLVVNVLALMCLWGILPLSIPTLHAQQYCARSRYGNKSNQRDIKALRCCRIAYSVWKVNRKSAIKLDLLSLTNILTVCI